VASDIAYTTVPGKIGPLLQRIQEASVPSKVTQSWLAMVGFTSTNDRSLMSVLKQVGFIDDGGRPTSLWERFRSGDRASLAQGIQHGYRVLYETYPDAHRRSTAELENIVKINAPRLNRDTAQRVTSTFRTLVGLAEFGENGVFTPAIAPSASPAVPIAPVTDGPPVVAVPHLTNPGVTINLNVQLSLPETTDASVYDLLFAAMKKHLLSGGDSGA
jgi:hypothetical protein